MRQRKNDTPTASLDRMVMAAMQHDSVGLQGEVQYFWRQGWRIAHVPDPQDGDPVRYALKACLLERMVQVWNFRTKLLEEDRKREQSPKWCKTVPRVPERVALVRPEHVVVFADDYSPVFMKRNFLAPKEALLFI